MVVMSKVAVITGASRGLGLAIATEFASNDWSTLGTGRSDKPYDLPAGVTYKQFDAGDATSCESFWKELASQYPNAEVCLINNAGGYVSGSLTETTPEDYEKQMRSCYFTAVYMTRGLAIAYPKARVINVISSSALTAHKNNAAYGAAKAAEMHFFHSLQAEFKPERYQITNLYPSDIASGGPNPDAIHPQDLAKYIRDLAESETSIYLRDATLYPHSG